MSAGPRVGAGTTVAGRYELTELLGTGGMAQVWAAEDVVLRRRVAVKLLHPHLAQDPAFVQRFRREAVAVARLAHPNIVAVYDTVDEGELQAIVMELVQGRTLRASLDANGPMSESECRRIGGELAGALDCAHRNGLVHRDIKPANILLTPDGTARLTDFGIAKADEDPELTIAGTLVGTAAYLAPEQVGGGRIDQRSDLYSLSTVLYEMASGCTPFVGDSPATTALARLHQDPVDLGSVTTGLSREFREVVMRNLERSPERRFQSAQDLSAALADPRRSKRSSTPTRSARVGPTPAPVAAARGRRARRPAGPRRSVMGRAALTVLVLGPLTLSAALIIDVPDGPESTGATPAPDGPRSVGRVVAFDPRGDRHEHDDETGFVVDGDPTTTWSTERYEAQDFGTKPGVGLVVELTKPARIDRVVVTGTPGWRGTVTITGPDPTATTSALPIPPSGTAINMRTGSTKVSMAGARGRYVVIWITDLGPSTGAHTAAIAEIDVIGRNTNG